MHSNCEFHLLTDDINLLVCNIEAIVVDLICHCATTRQYTSCSIVVISSVTPSFGSTSGGTKIKLTGQFFNNTEKPLRVEVGGKPCTNLKLVSDTEMTCDTPPQPASQPFYTGQGFYRNLLICNFCCLIRRPSCALE